MFNDFLEENFYDRGKIYVMVERGIISAVFALLCLVSFSTPGFNKQIDRLKYPLKLASASFKGTYEDLDIPSYNDPNQGWGALKR